MNNSEPITPHRIFDAIAEGVRLRTADTERPPPDSCPTPVSLPALDLFTMTIDLAESA